MSASPAVVLSSSVLCPAGRGSEQAWATVRAGIARVSSSHVLDRYLDAIQMGLVPEDALMPLTPELESLPLPARARRMLRLAAPALKAIAADAGTPMRLYLGLPQLDVAEAQWLKGFALHLGRLAETPIDAPNSRVFPFGRASVLMALEHALQTLAREPNTRIVVGGVDTFLDLRLLATLDAEGRILGPRVMDGFIPGEGAAFLVLQHGSSAGESNAAPLALVHAAASVFDAGHRYGTEPARGEGLAQALELLRERVSPSVGPVSTTFAALTGEHFEAKLWGVAQLRHSDFFAAQASLEHPADCFGDSGAAAGAILMSLAATAVRRGQRTGPALIWAASDLEPRACAVISAPQHGAQ